MVSVVKPGGATGAVCNSFFFGRVHVARRGLAIRGSISCNDGRDDVNEAVVGGDAFVAWWRPR